jgi:hypothetical protein
MAGDMRLKTRLESLYQLRRAQDADHFRVLIKTVLYLPGPQMTGNSLTN